MTEGGATGVRIADGRVHRHTGPWTPAVHDLLAHVRAHGLPEAPEVLGFDDDGLEVLRFIDGGHFDPPVTDGQLVAIGRLLDRLRASMATFPDPAARTWRMPFASGTTLVHGDIAWWNLVFDGDDVIGVLDWDLAGLATPLYDLAYALWTCVPLEADLPLDDALRRARLLVDAFGASAEERAQLIEELAFAQARVGFVIAHGWATDNLGLAWIWQHGRRMAGIARSILWLDEHRDALAAALTL